MKAKKITAKQSDKMLIGNDAVDLDFVAGIRMAVAELDRGENITPEELLKRVPEWARRAK